MKKITVPVFRWAVSLLLAMALSYLLVGYLLERSGPKIVTQKDRSVAADLRVFTNELIALVDEFINKSPSESMAEIATFENWVARSFRPRINDIRQRLVLANISNDALTALLAASDRCATLSARPRDDRIRESALLAVAKAASETERFVAQFDSAENAMPRPLTPSFASR